MDPKKSVWIFCIPIALVFISALACGGGATLGENSPGSPNHGGATFLDDATLGDEWEAANGSIHVDPETEVSFIVQSRLTDDERIEKRLVAVQPEGAAHIVKELHGFSDIRVLSTLEELIVMAENEAYEEELFWFDKSGRRQLRHRKTETRYHGARLSPKRRYIVVKDHSDDRYVHFLNAITGEVMQRKPLNLDECPWVEGQWLNTDDLFFLAEFGHPAYGEDGHEYASMARLHFLRPGKEQSESFCLGTETAPDCDRILLPDVQAQFFGFSTWISVTRDDRYVAVPASIGDTQVVFVVDTETKSVRTLENAIGPVAFTSDSKTLVAYGKRDGELANMKFVDLETFEIIQEPIPEFGTPHFFVSHDSREIVITELGGASGDVVIFDLDSGEFIALPSPQRPELWEQLNPSLAIETDPGAEREIDIRRFLANPCNTGDCYRQTVQTPRPLALNEFVTRGSEIWGIHSFVLTRFDFSIGVMEELLLEERAAHINILPDRDLIVLDTEGRSQLQFMDPTDASVIHKSEFSLGW